jgi:hypothetical protein
LIVDVSEAKRKRLEEELALCERRIALIRELIAGQHDLGAARGHKDRGRGRPNAGIRRFLLEEIRATPGVDIRTLADTMADKGFVGTHSRPLKTVVSHEVRTLVRNHMVRQLPGRTFVALG